MDTRTRNWLLAIVAAAIIFSAAMSMRDKSANEPVPASTETTQQDSSGG